MEIMGKIKVLEELIIWGLSSKVISVICSIQKILFSN